MTTSITVTSKQDTGIQVLKDRLTPTEKKILIHMLNAGMSEGQVRNKVFYISKTENNTAKVEIGTTVKSIIFNINETVIQRVKIKYA